MPKRVLELTNFSSGGCGVFARAKQEAIELSKLGYEVKIFSSDFKKGSYERLPLTDSVENIPIVRFKAKKLGGESFLSWDFSAAALEFKPDIIIAHSYRHKHTSLALKIAKILGCKVFLVTHAPFGRSSTRGIFGKLAVLFYDAFIGPSKLKKFNKIITITEWENPYLKDLGVKEEKMEYIPNGIPDEFFKLKKTDKSERKLLFFGRIALIKDIETLIRALKETVDLTVNLEIVGPVSEANYKSKLDRLIVSLGLNDRVKFSEAIYDLEKKIRKIDQFDFFVLPSKSEGMPQSLVEAMARGKIVIASNIPANKELVRHVENGFLFKQGDEKACAEAIDKALSMQEKDLTNIKINATRSAEQYSYKNIIKKIEKVINE